MQSRLKNKKIKKYGGVPTNIKYRSLWERQAFKYLDANPSVIGWNSEEVVVRYRCKTDGKMHRYFTDLFIRMKDGKCFLVEIKPKKQTVAPKQGARKTKKYIKEVMTYAKNISKWEAATEFAHRNGMTFQIWNEDTLKSLGIKLLT